ncbi:MAG TPA: nitrophenyl compound nitroreductase subunit ArsF family protein [Salinivirgaceae bacterium]|jgi:hypothetical protein|nr:nitrophenyl compound nitroreductase subunit ArsF family protein [Salinivirgaceae bacterium]HRS67989.1 nitrophenyl compound nitroreductase subunit ArsF family protein [Paludibacteraceae bacterium]
MRNVIIILLFLASFSACSQSGNKTVDNKVSETVIAPSDTTIVNVYYFHGKQRCQTCVAVGEIAKETVEKDFAGNNEVRFTEINVSDKVNEALAEKYEVSWNALIIAKGDKSVEITEQAFANALSNPESLKNLIIEEVNRKL